MKKILLLTLLMTSAALAHDHVEVGIHPANPGQLALDGPGVQLAPYVPVGEFFSSYATNFPGGCFASELTFTTENNNLEVPEGADPVIELVSVTEPTGGSFSFWEVSASSPTWTRPAGWTQTVTNRPFFPVILNGDNHAHGRAFTVDRPGEYQVTFRAVDRNAQFENSLDYTIAFRAKIPPPLSISLSNSQAIISFTSRTNLTYELQTRTNLSSGLWQTNGIPTNNINGDGALKEVAVPLSHPRAFFRLIEFK